MTNPRKYTCKLLEMVDSGILSANAVINAAMSYMLESEDSPDDYEGVEITVGSTVTVEGVEYVAVSAKAVDSCKGCDGSRHCRLLPDCDGIIFVRKEKQ